MFNIWKTNRMTLFCNLFIERPSYFLVSFLLRRCFYSLEQTDCLRTLDQLVTASSSETFKSRLKPELFVAAYLDT